MFGTYQRLGLHVGESNIAVIRAARAKLTESARRSRNAREDRHNFYRQMIDYHSQARRLVSNWRLI